MNKEIIPLLNSGENTEGETSLPEAWERIQNVRLTGDQNYLRYVKRNGLDKKSDCPITNAYTIDAFRDTVIALGTTKGSIYNKDSNTWGDEINIKKEYEQEKKSLSLLPTDFDSASLSAALSQVLFTDNYLYHAYVDGSNDVHVDLLDLSGNFITKIFRHTLTSPVASTVPRYVYLFKDASYVYLFVLDKSNATTSKKRVIYKFMDSNSSEILNTPDSASDWVTGTSYEVGDYAWGTISYRVLYKCIVAHTSGTLATDVNTNVYWEASISTTNLSALATSTIRAVSAHYSDEGKLYFGMLEEDGVSATLRALAYWVNEFEGLAAATPDILVRTVGLYNANKDAGFDCGFTKGTLPAGDRFVWAQLQTQNNTSPYGNMYLYTGIANIDDTDTGTEQPARTLAIGTNLWDCELTINKRIHVGQIDGVAGYPTCYGVMFSCASLGGCGYYPYDALVGTEIAAQRLYLGLSCISAPFIVNDTPYAFFSTMEPAGTTAGSYLISSNRDTTNNRCYLLELNSEIGKIPSQGAYYHVNDTGFPFPSNYSKSLYPITTFAYGENVPQGSYHVNSEDGIVYFSYFSPQSRRNISAQLYEYLKIDFNTVIKPQAIDAFGSLFIAGNIFKEFDGNTISENNFFEGPKIYKDSATAGANTYNYIAIYTYVDGLGNKSYSRPSNILQVASVNAPNTNAITVGITNCIMTAKKDIAIELYRTKHNGTVYRRVAIIENKNDRYITTKADSVADTSFDSASESFRFPLAYSDGSTSTALVNDNIGSVKNMVLHNGRMFVQSSIDDVTYYSKGKVSGQSLEFSIDLSISTSASDLKNNGATAAAADSVGLRGLVFGTVGASASNGGYYIMLMERMIIAIAGDGGDIKGANPTFSEPIVISDSQGCTEPQTVVNTPLGVIFKGRDSWYVLDRSLSLEDIGNEISDYFSTSIKSSSVSLTKGLVYYFLDSSDGKVLIYDYKNGGRWLEDVLSIDSPVDSTVIDGKLAAITNASTDNFFIEGSGYKDNGVHYNQVFRSSWLKFDMIQKIKRVSRIMVLGQLKTKGYTYKVKEYKDFKGIDTQWVSGEEYKTGFLVERDEICYECVVNHTSSDFNTDLAAKKWVQQSVLKEGIPSGRQTDIHATLQKSDSFKFEVAVIPDSDDTGEAIEVENISLLVGVDGSRAKTPSINRG